MGHPSLAAASAALAELDPVMAELVEIHGPCRMRRPERAGDRFQALANAIVYQQLAGQAARAIWGRVRGLVDGSFTPEAVLALSDEFLRGAGLSGSKVASLRDLADKVASGQVRLARIGRLSDDEVEAELVQVRGIGPWTAHMFLMSNLRRPDVWPTGDYGVRAGYSKAFDLAELPSPAELLVLGERFRPYRSVAAWYCWRAADTFTPG